MIVSLYKSRVFVMAKEMQSYLLIVEQKSLNTCFESICRSCLCMPGHI